MREAFHDDLEAVFSDLAAVCDNVATAVVDATGALLGANGDLAERVISGDVAIDRARDAIEANCIQLLSLQAPVAGDLRVVVAALRMVSDLERMGDLSVHVAKVARLRLPGHAVPPRAEATIRAMAEIAEQMVRRTSGIVRDRDIEGAAALAVDDEAMDQLRRGTFVDLLGADWTEGVESAVDVALLGRYYERIAVHAVSVANRVVFVVTGERPRSTPA